MLQPNELVSLIKNRKWRIAGFGAVFAIHFACFYWWSAGEYFFSGDGLFYFSRRITSAPDFWSKFLSLDDLYQYRPLPYVIFSFVLHPLFGAKPAPYHLLAYIIGLANILLACAVSYYWLGRDSRRAVIASIFLILNPVNFFPSYGLSYIDVLASLFFYLLALVLILANTRWTPVLAPAFTALALLSREHSVMLPLQAAVILIATGIRPREAISRTRNVWLVLAGYVAFQLFIRQGNVFAPATANSNLQFHFSLERIGLLISGLKPAIYFPENYHLGELLQGSWDTARLAFVIPWVIIFAMTLYRRDKVALSGVIWIPLSLLPIAFIQFPPFARHYYLALPGVAVLFASTITTMRVMRYVTAIFALVTITSVALYAQESWIAEGSRLTKRYFREIEMMAIRSERNDFYVLNDGDQGFYWHIDAGRPVDQFLKRKLTFRFAVNAEQLPMEPLLSNAVNIVVPTWQGIQDAVSTGRFPDLKDDGLCKAAARLTSSQSKCSVFYRGRPAPKAVPPLTETANEMPIYEMDAAIVTLSRTTIFFNGNEPVHLNADVLASAESTDGVSVQMYKLTNGRFEMLFEKALTPGDRFHLDKRFDGSIGSLFVLRVGPGMKGDETGDRLIWNIESP